MTTKELMSLCDLRDVFILSSINIENGKDVRENTSRSYECCYSIAELFPKTEISVKGFRDYIVDFVTNEFFVMNKFGSYCGEGVDPSTVSNAAAMKLGQILKVVAFDNEDCE